MQKNDNFPFLKKLVESVKQAVDAQVLQASNIQQHSFVWKVDLAMSSSDHSEPSWTQLAPNLYMK